MSVVIRTATEDDAEELRRFAERLLAEQLPGIFERSVPTLDEEREFIRSHLEPANSTLLVASMDGVVVGVIDLVGGTRAEEAHAGTFGLSVDREHRGRGVGTALIEALMAWAPEHGITRIQAWAWANNPGAIALYERLGFEREALCRRAVISRGEAVDVILLARLLEA